MHRQPKSHAASANQRALPVAAEHPIAADSAPLVFAPEARGEVLQQLGPCRGGTSLEYSWRAKLLRRKVCQVLQIAEQHHPAPKHRHDHEISPETRSMFITDDTVTISALSFQERERATRLTCVASFYASSGHTFCCERCSANRRCSILC